MAKVDQIAAYIPQGKYKSMSIEEWKSFQDSVFITHTKYLKIIFKENGFIGYDVARENGSNNFWLMIQHADHDPNFQKKVLKEMKKEVKKGTASASRYGLLLDRVNINTGKRQIYGTQVTYNMDTGQAYPKPLEDSANVNLRRKKIGLEPLEEYLNSLTIMHLEMNMENYKQKGITKPKLYKTN